MFRELLVHHHSSLEYRAKILTLMVSSNGEICPCEKQALKEIAHTVYEGDEERAELLIDTVMEYHQKIVTDNGLDFEHLVLQVEKETRNIGRFVEKINFGLLEKLRACTEDEEEVIFQERIMEFLQMLKEEYGNQQKNV